MTSDPLFWIVAAACILVAIILAKGISTFGKGGDPKRANKLMQYRIIAQFVAVILIVGFVYIRRQMGGE